MKASSSSSSSKRVKDMLASMTLEDKIGQMSQVDIGLLLEDENDGGGPKRVSMEKLEHYIGELGVGSVLNTVDDRWDARQFRQVVLDMQDVATKYDRPPVIYGLDSVHGANYIDGAILTPQPLNLAATFNTTVAHVAGQLASRDTRAAGISWLFSPILGLALEPKWSRVFETFGEDPKLVADMGVAMIRGIQEPGEDEGVPSRAAACAKHFVGYSLPHDGHDRSPSWIPTRHLHQYFVPPWRAAISKQKVRTVMESYTEYDGVPNVANRKSLHTLLRQQLGFEGVLVTDYSEILNLNGWHHVTASDKEATVYALKEGTVDMSMIPFDVDGFRGAIQEGIQEHQLSMERIDRSVERILQLKEELGMMDEKLTMEDINIDKVGSQEDRDEVLGMAHQSIVLVENQGTLPLNPTTPLKIHVTGPTANSLRFQSGGWTKQWQGAPNDADWFTYGSTVLQAATSIAAWDVTYSCGVDILGNECDDPVQGKPPSTGIIGKIQDLLGLGGDEDYASIAQSADFASQADFVIVCIGEENYAEKPGDIRSLRLPEGQLNLIRGLSESDAKIILVYFGGRPRLLGDAMDHVHAALIGFLPGPDAGTALMDIVTGKVNPSGRLPITYPKFEDLGGSPYFLAVSDKCNSGDGPLPHWRNGPCEVQWPFGHGLAYTMFAYSDLTLSGTTLKYRAPGQKRSLRDESRVLTVSVSVRNIGIMSGAEAVMFFTFDESRHSTPEYKRLRAFEKVHLAPGETQVVTATLSLNDPDFLSIGPHDDTHLVVQNKLRFKVGVGASVDCRQGDHEMCSDYVVVDAGNDYIDACDAACSAWEKSPCGSVYGLSAPSSCWAMCTSAESETGDGWGWNYVQCIEEVSFDILQGDAGTRNNNQCWKMTAMCRDIFSRDSSATSVPNTTNSVPALAIGFALVSGLLVTAFILFAMRGGMSRFVDSERTARGDRDDIQFSVVDSQID